MLPALPGHVEAELYEPDLVLDHASDIALTASQTAEITRDARDTQAQWDELAGQLHTASAALSTTLSTTHVDPDQAVTRAADVLRLEDGLKAAHLGLLVRTKNRLTAAQQRQLDAWRAP